MKVDVINTLYPTPCINHAHAIGRNFRFLWTHSNEWNKFMRNKGWAHHTYSNGFEVPGFERTVLIRISSECSWVALSKPAWLPQRLIAACETLRLHLYMNSIRQRLRINLPERQPPLAWSKALLCTYMRAEWWRQNVNSSSKQWRLSPWYVEITCRYACVTLIGFNTHFDMNLQ